MKTVLVIFMVMVGYFATSQTIKYTDGDNTIELETAANKKWFKDSPAKIIVSGIRIEFDTYAGKERKGAFIGASLKGLNQELLNEIGNQFYEDFKSAHEANGFSVSLLERSTLEANAKYMKQEKKGKVRLIEGGDFKELDKGGKIQSVTIYPDNVPYLFAGNSGSFVDLTPIVNMNQPVGSEAIMAHISLKIDFYEFEKGTSGVAGRWGLYMSNVPEKNSSVNNSIYYYVVPKKAVGYSAGTALHPNKKISVLETDCVDVDEEKSGDYYRGETLWIDLTVNEEKFKMYVNGMLKEFADISAGKFKAHLDELK